MRRRVLLVGVWAIIGVIAVALEAGDTLFVQVRETELRSGPGFLSSIVARLEFGTEVIYEESRSGFARVALADGSLAGWVHESATRENRTTDLQLQGEAGPRPVSSREIALAGRGFSESLENEYGEEQDLDFAAVDRLEQRVIDPVEMVGFVQDADLRVDFLTGDTE